MNELPPQKLYERLREVTGTSSDEELAKAIGLGLRAVTRMRAGHGLSYERTIRLLRLAGYLRLGEEEAPVEQAQLRYRARLLQQLAGEVLELYEDGQPTLQG